MALHLVFRHKEDKDQGKLHTFGVHDDKSTEIYKVSVFQPVTGAATENDVTIHSNAAKPSGGNADELLRARLLSLYKEWKNG